MTKPIEVAVYIPDEEVKKWMQFQEHYELFNFLLEKGVFEPLKNGCISINFDRFGEVSTIQRNDVLYSRRHE